MADISSITLPGGGTYDLKDKNAVHTSDVDPTPTASSTNPVQSGGVYDAFTQKVPMANPSYGPYTASGGTMDVEYFYKSVGELVYVTGVAFPTATVGVTGRSDVTFSDLPKDIDASAPVFMSSNNCTVSSSDLRPVLQMTYLGGKGFRFQGQATLNRPFQFSIIYS